MNTKKQMNHFRILMIIIFCFEMNADEYQPSRGSELVHEIIAKTAKEIKNKYELQPCGSGASMPGGSIRTINLSFSSRKSYTRDQLRNLLIKITDQMILEVNNNEEIQKHLLNPPFNEKNVDIIIFNHDAKGYELYDPDICGAGISPDGLIYRTLDVENPLRYKNRYRETYEEALKLLRNID